MLWWFVETTLVAGLLAGAAALFSRIRPLSATARHLLWVVVLVKLMVPPIVPSPWSMPWTGPTTPPSETQPAPKPVEAEPQLALAPEFKIDDMNALSDLDPSPAIEDAAREPAALPVLLTSGEAPHDAQTPLPVLSAPAEPAAEVTEDPAVAAGRPPAWYETASVRAWLWLGSHAAMIEKSLFFGWLAVTIVLAVAQGSRIVRFQHRLRQAVPAPEWLVQEAEGVGKRLQVETPELLVVPGLSTPMLWCLGRPRLLVPARLVKSIEVSRWRGIFAHELAHLRRGDHWVGRLELAAGLLWWWNPVYWLARYRIDAEAELACDAWVVWTLPEERLHYAEVLFQICSEFSKAGSPRPSLGVAGSGRFFERRLSMILHERDSCRISPSVVVTTSLLALLAIPSWTLARPNPAAAGLIAPLPPAETRAVADDDDDDDKDKDKDDDKDKAEKDDVVIDVDDLITEITALVQEAVSSAKEAVDEAVDGSEVNVDEVVSEITALVDEAVSGAKESVDEAVEGAKAEADEDKDKDGEPSADFEKKVEAWAEKFAAEIEKKFGDDSEFAKKMEKFGEEIEKKFGDDSEFAKKMEKFGEEMEKKFGDGSEFAKKMEEFGKEVEKKFGDGSEFAGKMESLGKEMEKKFGEGSEFEKSIKEKFGEGSEFEKSIKEKFGEGSEIEKKLKEKLKDVEAKAKDAEAKARDGKAKQGDVIAKGKAAQAKLLKEQAKALEQKAKELEAQAKAEEDEAQAREALAAKLKAEAEAKAKAEAEKKSQADETKQKEDAKIKALESQVEELLKQLKALKGDN